MNKYIVSNLLRKVQSMTSRGCWLSKKPKNQMLAYDLYEELLDEIIARLPPKSVLQCRSLSKSWCSRIDSPNFIRKHAIQSATRARKNVNVKHQIHIEKDTCKILYTLKPKGPYLELDSLKFPGSCIAFDSCYGIICLYYKTSIPLITLWNPSIRRKLNVPNVPYHPSQHYSVVFGFGYNPIADDYQIVGLSHGSLQTLFLYSTKTNSWSEIALPKAPPFSVMSIACFVDGLMHWVVKTESPNTNDSYILTFDLSSHVFGMILLPNTSWVTIYLTIHKGYLVVSSGDGQDSSMWVRKYHNNVASWSKSFKVTIINKKEGCRVLKAKDYTEVPKAYNSFSGVSRTVVSSSDSYVKYGIDNYVETLALLDNETCWTKEETDCGEVHDIALEV